MPEPEPPIDFLTTLLSLQAWFQKEEIPYALIGGVAVGLISQPRATQDIDLVVWLDFEDIEQFLVSGARFGFVPRIPNAVEFAMRSRVVLLRHETTKISVDVSCGALPFELEMITRSIELRIGELAIRVATPEDLIITKAIAHRSRDLIDIDNLLIVHQRLDVERILHWVKEFSQILEMPELMTDFDNLLKSRKRVDD